MQQKTRLIYSDGFLIYYFLITHIISMSPEGNNAYDDDVVD